ncbi:MAG: Alkaline phosphatase [Marmoricola sp.]|nr:Alkaline phosphatase [Marmoricola sp.]
MVDRVRRSEPAMSARTSARRRCERAWHAVLRPERFWVGAVLALALVPAALGCGRAPDKAPDKAAEPSATPPRSVAPPNSRSDPTPTPRVVSVVTAGDIACNPLDSKYGVGAGEETGCRQKATSDLIAALRPDAVIPQGDNQYQHGSYRDYLTSYAPTWGRFLDITHPVIGNHEYLTPGAAGHFGYFGRAAGDHRKAYYSFDLGHWHIVVLNNSGCHDIGGCGKGSPQERWLQRDLATHRTRCTLAAWHEPRWSSGKHGSHPTLQALWKDLYAGGVDVVVGGHDHSYERFDPLDAGGNPDSRGVRSFVVGTGGVGLRGFGAIARGSAVRQNSAFGVLHLTLRTDDYDWRFVPVGDRFHDSGNGTCH